MLRLTTKVTSSPASSARSSSAAARSSSMASGRVSANSAVSSSLSRERPSRPFAIAPGHQVASDRALFAPSRAAPRDEAPVARLDDVEHTLLEPLGADVLRVDAQALGERDPVLRQPLASVRGRGERVLGRDVVAVGAQAAEVGGPRGHQLRPPVREVGRHLHADVGHQPPRLRDQALHLLDAHRGGPLRQLLMGGVGDPGAPVALRRLRGDLRRLLAVVGAMGDEVLEDDLLEVAVLGVDRGQRLQRRDPVLLALADADEDPAGEGDRAAPRPRESCPAGARGAWWATPGGRRGRGRTDSSMSPCDAVTSRRRASSPRSSTPRLVWGRMPRSSARSHAQAT